MAAGSSARARIRRRLRAARAGSRRRGGSEALRRYLAVGITGGIASGKSLVARYFEHEGIPVVDADPIGHELIRPGAACYRPLVARFGRAILDRRGRVNRRRLGAIVFADPARRRQLNALLHPPILREAQRRAHRIHERRRRPIVAVSAALLLEAGAARRFDRVVLVACRPAIQMRRLMRRRGLSAGQARARLAAQAGDGARRRIAHYVIANNGTRASTRARVRRVAEALRRLAAGRGSSRQKWMAR